MKLRSPSNYAQIVEFFKRLGSLSVQDLTIVDPAHCYVMIIGWLFIKSAFIMQKRKLKFQCKRPFQLLTKLKLKKKGGGDFD